MPEPQSIDKEFINKITGIIEDKMSDEQFGVSELAHEIGMSRSNLLRKVKKATNLSASQFISQVRLNRALELLKEKSLNVSEVSFRVGFNSVSYFIKCFHEQYGYPPGEVGKNIINESEAQAGDQPTKKKTTYLFWTITVIILVATIAYLALNHFVSKKEIPEKSIAVLPFKNDSNDSSNVYFINGLMESILNNLQNIEDLRVISRTSVEKYRNSQKTIAEMSKELNVDYFVEGSGQKIGNKILLNVQLIEASSDNHLWAKQYSRKAKDIFNLQNEIAENIADKIEVIITPEAKERINKIPTDDLVAYDYFLKGLDLFYKSDRESIEEAIEWFKKAIERDNEFARANAGIAIAYYSLDITQTEKQYADQINFYADKALLFDPKLPQSLIAKALFYMNSSAYELAVPYLEKALEYNPNSALVINILSDFYTRYVPNTEKYLEYALKGIQLDIAAHDSVTASFIFLHLSNAFIQSGFIKEAELYINKSLDYYPGNLYSEYVKAYILYAENKNLKQLKEGLLAALQKDTSRLDILQEVGKAYYFERNYDSAYKYYKKFTEIRNALNMDIYRSEDAKIAVVLSKVGLNEESKKYLSKYKEYADYDESIYKDLSLAAYYSYQGETANAIEHLRLFSQQENYHYWIVLFLEIDPLMDNIKNLPEFRKLLNEIKTKFRKYHNGIRGSLEEKGIL